MFHKTAEKSCFFFTFLLLSERQQKLHESHQWMNAVLQTKEKKKGWQKPTFAETSVVAVESTIVSAISDLVK